MIARFLSTVADRLSEAPWPSAKELSSGLQGLSGTPGAVECMIDELTRALCIEDRDPLADEIAPFAARLPWKLGDGEVSMPEGFAGRYRFCEIVGPNGLAAHQTIRFGAYLQFAETFYPMHSHEAEEIYLPISGTARWWRDDVAGEHVAPGTLIRHAPWERHATQTTGAPLLALWGWTGAIGFGSHRVDGAEIP